MQTSLRPFKQVKQHLRKTWLYSAKAWFMDFGPVGIRHHRKTVNFYAQFLKPGDLCFDIGANMGNKTQAFLELGSNIIAVEPQDICLERLHQRFAAKENVVIVNKAVGESEGVADLSICNLSSRIATFSDKWKNDSRFTGEFEWTRSQSVAVTTLDHLIELYGLPTFCKIDVEGFELPVLKGLTQPISYLSFEFNSEFALEVKECIAILKSFGQVEFNCSERETMEWLFTEWFTPDELCQWVDSMERNLFWGDIYARFI